MSVTAASAREMAMSLEEASEAPHFHRIAFRTPRKTFATLDAEACDLNLMFDPKLRNFYCEQEPAALARVRRLGAHGRDPMRSFGRRRDDAQISCGGGASLGCAQDEAALTAAGEHHLSGAKPSSAYGATATNTARGHMQAA